MTAHRSNKRSFVRRGYVLKILALAKTKAEASNLEKYYIVKLKTLHPFGYNKYEGGLFGYKINRTAARKVAAAARKRWAIKGHPRLGKLHSSEAKKKIGDANRGHTHWVGRKHSEAAKLKMSKAKKGRVPWNKGVSWKRKINRGKK